MNEQADPTRLLMREIPAFAYQSGGHGSRVSLLGIGSQCHQGEEREDLRSLAPLNRCIWLH